MRKKHGSIPSAVRPHLPALIKGLEGVGVGATDAADGIAAAFNVTRSAVWKATELRSNKPVNVPGHMAFVYNPESGQLSKGVQ